jgi:hypothetical protein
MPAAEEPAAVAEAAVEPVEEVPVVTPFQQRVADLETIRAALEAYHADTGGYPNTNGKWNSVSHQNSLNWLPELVPNYLNSVPTDPFGSWKFENPQYMYTSDGIDYKLIAHRSGDCDQLTNDLSPSRDPVRATAEACWGFGFWTAGFAEK